MGSGYSIYLRCVFQLGNLVWRESLSTKPHHDAMKYQCITVWHFPNIIRAVLWDSLLKYGKRSQPKQFNESRLFYFDLDL